MIKALKLRPDQVLAEIAEYNARLAAGFKNLKRVGALPSGVTPRKAVYRQDKITLYRYINPAPTNKTPLLIVYALVNRPYMADLQENRSLIRGLMETGQDVYLIDWGYAGREDRFLTMNDYINGYIDTCVDLIRRHSRQDSINMLGICQGGTFSLCYTALHGEKVKNLVTMVTPVDFHTPDNTLSAWVRHIDIDILVDALGNVPGDLMNWTFLNLKPNHLLAEKYINMADVLHSEKSAASFMAMEKWIFDSPDQAGETYREFVRDFYQKNLLIKGEVTIGGNRVNLAHITQPVLNIYAQDDHLVPPSATVALKLHVGSKDYTELSFKGGHIGIYVSAAAQKLVPPSIGQWLNERSTSVSL